MDLLMAVRALQANGYSVRPCENKGFAGWYRCGTPSLSWRDVASGIIRRAEYLREEAGGRMATTRHATEEESASLLQGDPGFVLEDGDTILGHVAYRALAQGFTVHSLLNWGPTEGASSLVQAAVNEARRRGFSDLYFHVQEPDLSLLRLCPDKAKIVSAVLRMEL